MMNTASRVKIVFIFYSLMSRPPFWVASWFVRPLGGAPRSGHLAENIIYVPQFFGTEYDIVHALQ
jgi:hypothetical protein